MVAIGKLDGCDWEAGWLRLESWMVAIGKLDGCDWQVMWLLH